MRLPIPGPGDLVRLTERSYVAVETALGLVPRLVTLVGDVEAIVARVAVMVGEIEVTQAAARTVVVQVEGVVAAAAATVARTETIVQRAGGLTDQLVPLMTAMQPTLEQLQPLLDRLVQTTSPEEVDALVKLIDTMPELVSKVDSEVFPVLDTLGTVAPDLRDLLDLSRELNEMLGALPGLGRVKKRIEKEQAEEDAREAHTADREPPSSP